MSKSESVVNIATGDVIDLNNININNNNGSGDISSGSSYNMRQLEQLIDGDGISNFEKPFSLKVSVTCANSKLNKHATFSNSILLVD
ncbi:18284_t:CDS:2 [Entrophospora sp. SA101]|nr:18284_t:CDS:2 [Entrophospora sp. SA101]